MIFAGIVTGNCNDRHSSNLLVKVQCRLCGDIAGDLGLRGCDIVSLSK